jgi:hypothetical protein
MIRNVLIAAVLAFGFAATSSAAVVYVQVAPPYHAVEAVPAAPGPGYVWVGGVSGVASATPARGARGTGGT